MSLRGFNPWRVHPAHPAWAQDDDEFYIYPFSSVTPRLRRQETWNPFIDFERTLSAGDAAARKVQATKSKEQTTTIGHASDDKNFIYNFDLSGFEPKYIKLKTIGQKVVVEAENEVNEHKEGCHSFCHRHYHRSLVLPENVKPEEVKSTINADGVLCITAPLLAITAPEAEEREIRIQREDKPAVVEAPMDD